MRVMRVVSMVLLVLLIPALAQGYLALVIPLDDGDRIPGVPFLHELGESLSH